MKKFDLLICDMTTPHPYEQQTLQTQAMGGTEASVIRVAEGLASLGAHVGVVQHNLNQILMGENAYYIPLSMLDELTTHNYVALRGTQFFDKFPKANKYSWHEDVPNNKFVSMKESFLKHNVTVIAASKWHKGAMQQLICNPNDIVNPKITYIYNPCPDEIYIPKSIDVKYDANKLVWIASPHKGLNKAVKMFERLVEVSGNQNYRLHLFNPGYCPSSEFQSKYVVNHGPVPAKTLWQHVSESLCVFYPTEFEETFGCIAAEANALHVPVLTCPIAALNETVSSQRQFVPRNDPKAVIDTVIRWNKEERPKVWGNDEFRSSNVVQSWYNLLTRKNT